MRMTKIWILTLALLLGAPLAAASVTPTELVKDTADQILTTFQENRADLEGKPEKIYHLVDEIVLPHFDFQRMSQLVLGKYWRQASTEQRERFTHEFRTLLVRTYSKALEQYRDQTINYLPMRGDEQGGDVLVRTEVQQSDGYPIPINYSLYLVEGQWKVYDVVIDNVSLVTNYRSSFATDIRKGGLDNLIARLAERNQQNVQ